MELERGSLVISTDPARIDLDVVHGYLGGEAYWSRGIERDRLARAIGNSLCFSLYDGERQVGFARVITDRATFAYLCDVFVLDSHRGRGLGTWLMECVAAHPDLARLRRWVLATRDAHPFYEQLGWSRPPRPDAYMEIAKPGAAEADLDDLAGKPRG
jgi:GNAT superfamily N-acetyltransferase